MAEAKQGEVVKPKEKEAEMRRKSNTVMILVIVVLVILGLCGLCALCGGAFMYLLGEGVPN